MLLKQIPKWPLLLLLLIQLTLPVVIHAAESINIGVLAFRPKPIVEAKWQPLVNYLNREVQGVEFTISALNYTELEKAIDRKTVDFVFTNSSHFVQLAHKTNLSSPLATLINKKSGQPVRNFAGTILVKNTDTNIQALEDLSGKTIATPSQKSFGGFKMQAYELHQVGINLATDVTIKQTTMPHDKAIVSVMRGEADAAFVRSGVLESMEKSGKIRVGQLRVLNLQMGSNFPFLISTRLYPEWPFAAMPHVGEALAGRIAGALLALPHDGEITQMIGIHGFRIPADYEPIREVLRTLRVYPYDKTPEITLTDLWEQHRAQMVSALLAVLVISFLIILLFVYNRRLHDHHEKLQENNESLRIAAVAFDTQEAIFITDKNERIIRVNGAFTRVTGYSDKEAIGQTPRILHSGRHSKQFYHDLWANMERNGYWQGEVWNRRKNGEIFPVGQTITTIKDDDGQITHYLSTFDDISAFKENEERIKKLAFYDPLTGLANRRLLQDHLKQARAHSTRKNDFFALLFIDLDHFKTLNDTLGHNYGDHLLQQVAQRLTETVREGDTVSRTGGDEFIVLLEELGDTADEAAQAAKTTADNLLKQISVPYFLKGREYPISASIGISIYTDHTESIEEMMVRSDLAMYQAKSAGRNTIRFFDPSMQESIQHRSKLEAELRQAIQQDQFVLYYQPKLNPQQQILGYEALIRWNHPKHGILAPGAFIEVAEDSGLIIKIGQWVLRQACVQLSIWHESEETKHLTLAVNISEKQLRRERFVDQVKQIIDATHCPPDKLELEITESLLMKEMDGSIQKIKQLRALGITFAIDDFGTGYSSLNYLKKLPVDWLKIDQSFVHDMLNDPQDEAIVKTILALSETLGLMAIAEGVETEQQKKHLIELGCPILQGYLFDKPKPVEELVYSQTKR